MFGLAFGLGFYSAEQTHFLDAGSKCYLHGICLCLLFRLNIQSKIKMNLQTCTEYLIQNLDVTKTVLNSTPQHFGLLHPN